MIRRQAVSTVSGGDRVSLSFGNAAFRSKMLRNEAQPESLAVDRDSHINFVFALRGPGKAKANLWNSRRQYRLYAIAVQHGAGDC